MDMNSSCRSITWASYLAKSIRSEKYFMNHRCYVYIYIYICRQDIGHIHVDLFVVKALYRYWLHRSRNQTTGVKGWKFEDVVPPAMEIEDESKRNGSPNFSESMLVCTRSIKLRVYPGSPIWPKTCTCAFSQHSSQWGCGNKFSQPSGPAYQLHISAQNSWGYMRFSFSDVWAVWHTSHIGLLGCQKEAQSAFVEFVALVDVTNLGTFDSCRACIWVNFRDIRPRHPTKWF